MTRKNQKGQAVLVVLLSLSVVLIIVLFILSRSITDISLSTKEEDSLRAFSAAEAGVERALVIGNSSGSLDDAEFSALVTQFASGADQVTYPLALKSGENAVFWFKRAGEVTQFNGSNIRFCWGNAGTNPADSDTPALEVTFYYTTLPDDMTTLQIERAVYDPNVSRVTANRFDNAQISSCTIGQDSFAFQATIDTPTGTLEYATAKLLYNTTNAHKVGINVASTGSILPSQGEKVESAGSYGDANRSIEVYQLHPETPPIFANAIFSANGIVK
ncbi:MAG: hypothetical protein QY322_00315 [bacterium]|nr:MAG: hypothetical protein QY322_00315 [bacterium]